MFIWTICWWLIGVIVALFLLGVALLLLALVIFGISYVYTTVSLKENWVTKFLKEQMRDLEVCTKNDFYLFRNYPVPYMGVG